MTRGLRALPNEISFPNLIFNSHSHDSQPADSAELSLRQAPPGNEAADRRHIALRGIQLLSHRLGQDDAADAENPGLRRRMAVQNQRAGANRTGKGRILHANRNGLQQPPVVQRAVHYLPNPGPALRPTLVPRTASNGSRVHEGRQLQKSRPDVRTRAQVR